MSRKQPDERIENPGLSDGLKHNPFASLRKDGRPAEVASSPAPHATPAPTPPREKKRVPPAASTDKTSSSDRIVVRRERKGHGGKSVTLAAGAGLDGQDLEVLAREAARALGVGARVEDGALVVQGEQTERLITWLSARGFRSVVRGN